MILLFLPTITMADLLKWSKDTIKDMKSMILRKEVFNTNQCRHLITQCDATIIAFEKLVDLGWNLILQDLYRIMIKAKDLVENSSRDDWWNGAIMQLDMKEAFRDILFDLKCCFFTLCDMTHEPKNMKANLTFFPVTIDTVLEDTISNRDKLLAISSNTTLRREIRELAKYLVEKMEFLQDAEGRELESIVFPETSDITVKDHSNLLGSGGFGSVYHANWFGLVDCAVKVLKIDDYDTNEKVRVNFDKEACILGGLSHPNVVKLMCCGIWENDGKKQRFLGMEKMEMDLSKFMKDKHFKQITPLVATDLMLQIAEGMSYLHDMKVAHRDLKPSNILLTPLVIPNWIGEGYAKVKLVDFDIAKTELTHSKPLVPTGGNIGTIKYMAPEMFDLKRKGVPLKPMYAFKADVFSFGILCSDILSTEKPIDEPYRTLHEIYEANEKGERPILPIDTSEEFKSLINHCCLFNASKRPTFTTICKRLQHLKKELLTRSSMIDAAPMKIASHLHDNSDFISSIFIFFWSLMVAIGGLFRLFASCSPITKDTHEDSSRRTGKQVIVTY
jgi:serine/threonine protein kinase